MSPLPPRPELWTLDPTVLHLNHGSYGGVPRRTQEVAAALRAETESNPLAWFRGLPARVTEARTKLAFYLGTDPAGFALISNASAGVTAALATVPIPVGSTVVVTDHAYGAVRYACERFARLNGAEVRTVAVPLEITDDELVALIGDAIDGRTAVVVLDQITSGTAMVFPVAKAAQLCRQAGVPLIVDGAHAPAQLDEPAADGADFWTGNFHKWPCSPRGTAGVVVAERWRDRTVPLVASWSEYDAMPERFDQQGTADYVSWLAAPTSLEVLAGLDWPRRRGELTALLEEACWIVAKALGTRVPDQVSPAPLMRLVDLPSSITDADAFRQQVVRDAGAEITVTGYGDRKFIRLSAHAYNTPRDYELLADRLRVLL